jgi:hypothetical protein
MPISRHDIADDDVELKRAWDRTRPGWLLTTILRLIFQQKGIVVLRVEVDMRMQDIQSVGSHCHGLEIDAASASGDFVD